MKASEPLQLTLAQANDTAREKHGSPGSFGEGGYRGGLESVKGMDPNLKMNKNLNMKTHRFRPRRGAGGWLGGPGPARPSH